MTCYMRHMTYLFEVLGLEYDAANRKRVDAAIRQLLSVPSDSDCPDVWSAIKALNEDARASLPTRVAEELGQA